MQIVVSKVDKIHSGDWHDKPLKWRVVGPGNEVQNFSTKKDAMRYKSIRRKAKSFDAACNEYARS